MTVYAVLHNSMYMESAASTLSIHKTLTGAYKKMQAHKWKTYQEERDNVLRRGRWRRGGKYLAWQWWGIKRFKIEE